MAYLTVAEYKEITGEALTAELQGKITDHFIPVAQRVIELEIGFTFESGNAAARLLDAIEDVDGRTLFFDTWAAEVPTAVTNNGVAFTDYTVLGGGPYWGLKLNASGSESWGDYGDDPEEAISVTAKWGYSATPPLDIVDAVVMIVQSRIRNRQGEMKDWLKEDFTALLGAYPAFRIAH